MKTLVISIVFAFLGIGVGAAQPPKASQDPADIAAIKQLAQDMGDAMVHVDIDKLSQIYADDFITVGRSGKVITKADILNDFRSFHDKLESFENGPIDVQVSAMLPCQMAALPRGGFETATALTVCFFGWTYCRSVLENGKSCALRVLELCKP